MKNFNIERELVYKATKAGIPLNGVFELTPVCNMKCQMCYARLTPEEIAQMGGIKSAAEWLKAARAAASFGTLFVLLTGGEPLLHPEFREIYLGLQELGMIVSVNTNGTLLNEEWVEFFAENPPRRLNITLYGASADTYQRICGYGQGYEKTIQGIKLLLQHGVAVKMNGTLVEENAGDYESMRKLAEELGVYFKVDSYLFPYARGEREKNIQSQRLNEKEQGYYQYREKQYSENFKNYVAHAGVARTLMNHPMQQMEETDWQEAECRAGRSSYWLDYSIRMLPCIFLPEGSVSLEGGFDQAWENCRKWIQELRLYAGCRECAGKRFCNVCAAALYAENQCYDKKPEYLCRCTESYIDYLADTEIEKTEIREGEAAYEVI